MKTSGCVDSYFGVACNASVHVLMYSYYLAASLGVRCPWKRYLTLAQMVQFCACAAHSLYLLATPGACPAVLPLTQLFVMSNMLALFARFYVVRVCPAVRVCKSRALIRAPLLPSQTKYVTGGKGSKGGKAEGVRAGAPPPALSPAGAPRVRRAE